MTKFILLASLLASSVVMSGELVNRKNFDKLVFELNAERQELLVTSYSNAGTDEMLFTLDAFNSHVDDIEVTQEDIGLFGLPFFRVGVGVEIMKREKIRNPLLIGSLFTLSLLLDVYALPIDLIDGGIKNLKINKDIRKLKKAIEDPGTTEVTLKRFMRIKNYLGVN